MNQHYLGTKKTDPCGHPRKVYEGKTFYAKNPDGTVDGPLDNIFYMEDISSLWTKFLNFVNRVPAYKFVQVVNGTPVRAFYENEIIVTMETRSNDE